MGENVLASNSSRIYGYKTFYGRNLQKLEY
jgi:hypothetical protein